MDVIDASYRRLVIKVDYGISHTLVVGVIGLVQLDILAADLACLYSGFNTHV